MQTEHHYVVAFVGDMAKCYWNGPMDITNVLNDWFFEFEDVRHTKKLARSKTEVILIFIIESYGRTLVVFE